LRNLRRSLATHDPRDDLHKKDGSRKRRRHARLLAAHRRDSPLFFLRIVRERAHLLDATPQTSRTVTRA
jgi:hypothetical protein